MTTLTTTAPLVIDGVLYDPHAYRAAALAMPRRSHELADGVSFHGIAAAPDRQLADWIEARYPTLTVVTTLTRLSPCGQSCPNYIHQDLDMGTVTGILYLNPAPPDTDGTTFWRDRITGAELSTAVDLADRIDEGFNWRDPARWEPTTTIAAKFNRLVLFNAALFHSRAIHENYGSRDDDARLIQIAFCTGVLS